ncbi:MAG: terminase family protein [Hyphomicrobiales bacterium]
MIAQPQKPAPCAPSADRAGNRRGRPPKYTAGQIEQARLDYLAGDAAADIAARLGCAPRTIHRWATSGGWGSARRRRGQSVAGLEAQIHWLSNRHSLTEGQTRRLAMLTRSLERLKRAAPQPKPLPVILGARRGDLLKTALADAYGLYPYQRAFLRSKARFRCILKSRQIGLTYVLALDCLLACAAGRDQIILSASQEQSDILIEYAVAHAARLDLALDATAKSELSLGPHSIRALPANPRTIQGFAGDVTLDEFAWHLRPKSIWRAVYPAITAIGGRVTVCSTPFVPGNLFWEIATDHRNRWSQWERTRITIHDAVAQGMALPGGIDQLRANLDGESWALMYECQWLADETALLSWELLEARGVAQAEHTYDGPVFIGVDVGRINDRTAIAVIRGEDKPDKDGKPRYRLMYVDEIKAKTFAAQRAHLKALHTTFDVARMRIDRTGLGMQLAEEMTCAYPATTNGVHFTTIRKERLALNLLRLMESGRLTIPRDPALFAQLHAVKRSAAAGGVRYDAARDERGHADAFWGVALAADNLSRRDPIGNGYQVEVLI